MLPGRFDPFDAWRRIPDLPSNVAILDANHKSHAAFKRDDTVVARVGTDLRKPERKGKSRRELRSEVQRPVPFTIAALASSGDAEDPETLRTWSDESPIEDPKPKTDDTDRSAVEAAATPNEEHRPPDAVIDSPVDYLALGGGRTRRTITKRRGIAHDPGPPQGNGFRETGPHGCTLVNVETDGTVRCDFVPTASVRWERLTVPVDGLATTHDLTRRCREVLSEVRWESSEHAWILEWVFEGPAAALGSLQDEAVRRQFQHELNEGTGIPNAEGAVHQIVLQPDSYRTDSRLALDPLHADFCEALAAVAQLPMTGGSLSELRAADRQWAERIESLLDELEPDLIRSHAAQVLRRLAMPTPRGQRHENPGAANREVRRVGAPLTASAQPPAGHLLRPERSGQDDSLAIHSRRLVRL